jgi:hypothetical protein
MSYWSCRLLSQSLKEAFFAMTVDSANAFPEEESEFHETGLTEMLAVKIKVPRVAEVPIHLECKLNQVIELGPHRHPLVLGEVVCKSASNLDPTPIVHQMVEAEAELFISGVVQSASNRAPLFFLENRLTAMRYSIFARVKIARRFTQALGNHFRGFFFERLRRRTPRPPPSSSIN